MKRAVLAFFAMTFVSAAAATGLATGPAERHEERAKPRLRPTPADAVHRPSSHMNNVVRQLPPSLRDWFRRIDANTPRAVGGGSSVVLALAGKTEDDVLQPENGFLTTTAVAINRSRHLPSEVTMVCLLKGEQVRCSGEAAVWRSSLGEASGVIFPVQVAAEVGDRLDILLSVAGDEGTPHAYSRRVSALVGREARRSPALCSHFSALVRDSSFTGDGVRQRVVNTVPPDDGLSHMLIVCDEPPRFRVHLLLDRVRVVTLDPRDAVFSKPDLYVRHKIPRWAYEDAEVVQVFAIPEEPGLRGWWNTPAAKVAAY